MLFAAAVWALGTQQLRHMRIIAPTLAIVFWMTLITTLSMTLLSIVFERPHWIAPSATTWAAIAYNAVLIFGFAQAVWLVLARTLPPVASSMSVMLIPVLGTLSGAWWLGSSCTGRTARRSCCWAIVAVMAGAPARTGQCRRSVLNASRDRQSSSCRIVVSALLHLAASPHQRGRSPARSAPWTTRCA
jgi:hypothetical protein